MVARFTELRYDDLSSGNQDFVEFVIPRGEGTDYQLVVVDRNGDEESRINVRNSFRETRIDINGVEHDLFVIDNDDGLDLNQNSGVALFNTDTNTTEEFISFRRAITADSNALPDTPAATQLGRTGDDESFAREIRKDSLTSNFTAQPLSSATIGNVAVVCLTTGAMIECQDGQLVPVEDLKVGDWVKTQTRGFQQLRWVGRRRIDAATLQDNPKLRPIRISSGALGNGLPKRDLVVSRQHRMLVNPWLTQDYARRDAVLIAAIKLVALDGVEIAQDAEEVEYFHLMFDQHEIIFAEGAPTESLYAGPEAMKMLDRRSYRELTNLFPELKEKAHLPDPVAYIPSNKEQKIFVENFRQKQVFKPEI